MLTANEVTAIRVKIENTPDQLTTEEINAYLEWQTEHAVNEALHSKEMQEHDRLLEAQIEKAHEEAAEARARLQALALEAVKKYEQSE